MNQSPKQQVKIEQKVKVGEQVSVGVLILCSLAASGVLLAGAFGLIGAKTPTTTQPSVTRIGLRPGWPVTEGLDNMGLLQINRTGISQTERFLVTTVSLNDQNGVALFDKDGEFASGWPQYTEQAEEYYLYQPAWGALDRAGVFRVVGVSNYYARASYVYVWDMSGNLMSGYPLAIEGAVKSSPVIADIDDDNAWEIIFAVNNYEGGEISGELLNAKIYVLEADGSSANGWPQEIVGSETMLHEGPAVRRNLLAITVGDKIYAYNANGELLDGWPVDFDNPRTAPVLVDLNDDYQSEIVVASPTQLTVLGQDGLVFTPGWPQTLDYTEATDQKIDLIVTKFPDWFGRSNNWLVIKEAQAQVDITGWSIIVAGNVESGNTYRGRVHVFSRVPTERDGWPKTFAENEYMGYLTTGEVDRTGLKILVSTEQATSGDNTVRVYAYGLDGRSVAGWPLSVSSSQLAENSLKLPFIREAQAQVNINGYGQYQELYPGTPTLLDIDRSVYNADLFLRVYGGIIGWDLGREAPSAPGSFGWSEYRYTPGHSSSYPEW